MTKDQTVKQDAGKLPLTLVPLQLIEDVAEVRQYGNEKYGDSESWRRVEIERYRDALFRHFIAYLRDPQGVDEESGIDTDVFRCQRLGCHQFHCRRHRYTSWSLQTLGQRLFL